MPRNRGLLADTEVVFAETIREHVFNKCFFNLVDADLRNYIVDQLLTTSMVNKDLNQLVFILAHCICIALAHPKREGKNKTRIPDPSLGSLVDFLIGVPKEGYMQAVSLD